MQLADWYNNLKCDKDYLRCGERLVELAPSNATCFVHRGSAHRYLNELDKAKEDFRRAMELSPTYEFPAFQLVEPGGMLLISATYHSYLKNLALALTGTLDQHFNVLQDAGPLRFFSMYSCEALLRSVGFDRVEFHRVGRIPAFANANKTVGFGMEPGDNYYAEPYFYVNMYPPPNMPPTRPLPAGGSWHSHEWIGAVLTGSRLERDGQRAQIDEFLDAAVAEARRTVLG